MSKRSPESKEQPAPANESARELREQAEQGQKAKDIREVDTTEYDESNAGEGPD